MGGGRKVKRYEGGSVPGNSVSEMGERMKGGAVNEDKSPEKDAILLLRTDMQSERCEVGDK